MPQTWLTPRDVELRYLVSLATLLRWRAAGIGPAWRRCGGRIRYDASSCADYFGSAAQSEETSR